MSKPKQKNPKIKIEQLKKPKKNMFRFPIPVNGFVIIDDPDYLFDEL